MKPTKAQFEAYQGMFEYFNDELFDNTLPNIILNFSRKGKNVGGFFSPERWAGADENGEVIKTHEISLNPDHWNTDFKDNVSTLVHEMAHLWQEVHGKPSRSGYHNKEWADKMDSIGLIASNTGEPGGNRTGQQMTHYIEENGWFDQAFKKMPIELILPFQQVPPPLKIAAKKTKFRYECICGNKVWGKEGLEILCNVCNQLYEES